MRHLNFVTLEGNGLSFQDGMLIQKVKGGFSKTRRDIVGSPVVTNISLQLNWKEYNQWATFYDILIDGGADIFTTDMMVDQWLVEKQTVQIISDCKVKFKGLTAFVDFQIEIKRQDNIEERKLIAEIIYTYGDAETGIAVMACLEQIANLEFNYTDANFSTARIRGEGQRKFNSEDAIDVTNALQQVANYEFLSA